MPTCQNCKQQFIIAPEDSTFYEKVNVPPPTFCPDCRLQRGFAWKNARSIYKRKCDLCGEDKIGVYAPDNIKDVGDDILKKIIACQQYNSPYRIIEQELAFYRTQHLPLPRLCVECRYSDRIAMKNPFRLFTRTCQCQGKGSATNTAKHAHGDAACPNEFQTSYSPDTNNIIYCDQCYLAEII